MKLTDKDYDQLDENGFIVFEDDDENPKLILMIQQMLKHLQMVLLQDTHYISTKI